MTTDTAKTRRIESGLVEQYRADNERLQSLVDVQGTDLAKCEAENAALHARLETIRDAYFLKPPDWNERIRAALAPEVKP